MACLESMTPPPASRAPPHAKAWGGSVHPYARPVRNFLALIGRQPGPEGGVPLLAALNTGRRRVKHGGLAMNDPKDRNPQQSPQDRDQQQRERPQREQQQRQNRQPNQQPGQKPSQHQDKDE